MLKPGEVHVREILPGCVKWDRGYRALATFRKANKLRTKYFPSMRRAKLWADEWTRQVAASGITQTIQPDELNAVVHARAELAEIGATLAEVIAAGMPLVRAKRCGVTVSDLIVRRLDYMRVRGCAKEHFANTQARLKLFGAAFGKRPAALVTTAEIDVWMSGLGKGPRTIANVRDSLHAMFANGVRLDLIAHNPVTKSLRPALRTGNISIFTLDQVRELLRVAKERNQLGYVVLGLFAGLRRSEILRLTPAELNHSWVRITHGKTRGSRRVVHLNATAQAWMPEDSLDFGGVRRLNELRTSLPFPWPGNGLRHSFASYHLAHFRDLAKLAAEMGSSPATIKRDYAELVTPEDAAAFWALRP